MDIPSILASLEERDKWRRRLLQLQEALRSLETERRRAQRRLRRVLSDLRKLERLGEALSGSGAVASPGEVTGGPANPHVPVR
jgi:chromosome segregation ATPase